MITHRQSAARALRHTPLDARRSVAQALGFFPALSLPGARPARPQFSATVVLALARLWRFTVISRSGAPWRSLVISCSALFGDQLLLRVPAISSGSQFWRFLAITRFWRSPAINCSGPPSLCWLTTRSEFTHRSGFPALSAFLHPAIFGAQLLGNWSQHFLGSVLGFCRAWSLRHAAAPARHLAPLVSQAASPLGALQRAAALVLIRFGARPLLAFGILCNHPISRSALPRSTSPTGRSLSSQAVHDSPAQLIVTALSLLDTCLLRHLASLALASSTSLASSMSSTWPLLSSSSPRDLSVLFRRSMFVISNARIFWRFAAPPAPLAVSLSGPQPFQFLATPLVGRSGAPCRSGARIRPVTALGCSCPCLNCFGKSSARCVQRCDAVVLGLFSAHSDDCRAWRSAASAFSTLLLRPSATPAPSHCSARSVSPPFGCSSNWVLWRFAALASTVPKRSASPALVPPSGRTFQRSGIQIRVDPNSSVFVHLHSYVVAVICVVIIVVVPGIVSSSVPFLFCFYASRGEYPPRMQNTHTNTKTIKTKNKCTRASDTLMLPPRGL